MLRTFIFVLSFCLAISSCRKPEPRRASGKKAGSSLNVSAERTKNRLRSEKMAIEQYIKKDTSQTYISSSQGFWYSFISENKTAEQRPEFGDKITYSYAIEDLNDFILYSPKEIGVKTHYIKQENILEGLRKAFTVIREEEEIKFIFPSQLAYGYKGDLEKIAPNTPLIMKIKLLSIEKTKNQ